MIESKDVVQTDVEDVRDFLQQLKAIDPDISKAFKLFFDFKVKERKEELDHHLLGSASKLVRWKGKGKINCLEVEHPQKNKFKIFFSSSFSRHSINLRFNSIFESLISRYLATSA